MLCHHHMTRAVQISFDVDLLHRIDRYPEARRLGRSAFVRHAVEAYLRAQERHRVDAALRRAFGGRSAAGWEREIQPLVEAQAWPED